MQARAILRTARISPQKARLVADQVRGMQVGRADQLLTFSPKKAAGMIRKVLLSAVSNAENKDVLWGFVRRYSPGATPEANPILDKLSDYAIRYFNDFVRPTKKYRTPDDVEQDALASLDTTLAALPADATADVIQNAILDVGRAIPRYQDLTKTGPHGGPGVKLDWFQAIYETLLGLERGPRLGTFVALYGVPETRALIAKARAGQLSAA